MAVPITIQCPDDLGVLLLKAATKKKCTIQAVIVDVLAAHYEIDVPAPKRGRPWPKKSE